MSANEILLFISVITATLSIVLLFIRRWLKNKIFELDERDAQLKKDGRLVELNEHLKSMGDITFKNHNDGRR